MINYNKEDKILSNIARIVEKRAKKELNLTLVLDSAMDEFDSKYEDGVIIRKLPRYSGCVRTSIKKSKS